MSCENLSSDCCVEPAFLHKALKEVDAVFLSDRRGSLPAYATPGRLVESVRCGWRVPDVRARLRQGYSFSSLSSQAALFHIWEHIWLHARSFEAMSSALYFLQGVKLSNDQVLSCLNWIERCQCWEHSDDLSKVYARELEGAPDLVLPTLRCWNTDAAHLWKRRQSVVSLLEYAVKRTRVLPARDLLAMVEPLLEDQEYYVQKGVGWTLREICNVYPKEALEFMRKQVLRIDSRAFSAAVEKLTPPERDALKATRKKARRAASKQRLS